MKQKKLSELEGGEVLAKEIVTPDFQVILSEGTVLRKEYIKRLHDLGIHEVSIVEDKESPEEKGELSILKSDVEKSAKEKVREILERHTYQNNTELMELSGTADNIITNILEDGRVVEKIFDIKERSADIYEHSISICTLAILTALKLNVEIQKIHEIGVGCLLHDIGFRYLSADYSNEDITTLSKQKIIEYKKHPVYGYSALKDEEWISDLSKAIILQHHERIDGSGFPLKTRVLPLECQIVTVCDSFDEMICGIACKRVKVYEAIEYLKSFKNILFNDKIVDAFLSFTAVYPAGTTVLTNEGELAVVVAQNKEFPDRPIIRILKDSQGKDVQGEVIKNLLKVHNIFIEKIMD